MTGSETKMEVDRLGTGTIKWSGGNIVGRARSLTLYGTCKKVGRLRVHG